MKGDIRCVGGTLWRHDPQRDDPDLEVARGPCPDCRGVGCERVADLAVDIVDSLPWMHYDRADDLAATIQQAIDTWIANEESGQEYPDPRDADDWLRHSE